jgi:hypothetical protein
MPVDSQIDEAITACLAAANGRWQKVAMVIVRATERLGLPDSPAGYDQVYKRIEVLVDDGRLMARGNISVWRHSELRLPS